MECQRVSVEQAAKELGMNVEYLRIQMRRGTIDIGKVIKPKPPITRYTYLIYREKLNRELGIGGEHEYNN